MSLFILLDPLIDDDEFKTHCLFFMAIMAFSTVLINGTTAKYVLEWLGLLKMTPQQMDVLQYVLKVRACLHPNGVEHRVGGALKGAVAAGLMSARPPEHLWWSDWA
jgi:hypothetical protein